jgi:hypothetical protein
MAAKEMMPQLVKACGVGSTDKVCGNSKCPLRNDVDTYEFPVPIRRVHFVGVGLFDEELRRLVWSSFAFGFSP